MSNIGDMLIAFAGWLWGIPLIITLVIIAMFMNFKLGFVQFRYFGYIFRNTLFGNIGKKKEENKGEGTLSAFQALTSALACTVGGGNIVGVPVAIASGGPGAIFWMWLVALIAMSLKYSEITLAVKYRKKAANGEWEGGPAHYMKDGLNMKWLAFIFCIALMIEVALSSMTQANALSASVRVTFGVQPLVTGIIVMIVTGVVLFGGVKALGRITEKLVPVMAILYIVCTIIVVLMNIVQLPEIVALILTSAFAPKAAFGGFAGSSVAMAIRWGLARGLYSNEAGVGTAPIAHSTATTDHPARQAMWGVVEIFLDTIVLCSCTAFVVLSTGTWCDTAAAAEGASSMTTIAFSNALGSFGGYMVSVSLIMFVFSTLLVLIWYGEKQAEFITNSTIGAKIYRFICVLLIPVGAAGGATYLWNFLDLSLAGALIPNLIAIVLLHKVVVKEKDEFFHTPGKYYLKDMEEYKKK